MKTTRCYDAVSAKTANDIGRKIQSWRKDSGLSLVALCALLEERGVEVKRSALNKWELGESVPNGYQLLALCELFGLDETIAYFSGKDEFNAEGRRKIREYRQDLLDTGKYAPPRENIRYKRMPVSLLSASAGTGDYLQDENFEYVDVPEDEVPEWASFGVHVNGDSMEPVYHDGQLVWIQLCHKLRPGEVGLFTLDGCGYIKLYTEQGGDSSGQPRPVLVSYNPGYSPIAVTWGANLQIVGKVL